MPLDRMAVARGRVACGACAPSPGRALRAHRAHDRTSALSAHLRACLALLGEARSAACFGRRLARCSARGAGAGDAVLPQGDRHRVRRWSGKPTHAHRLPLASNATTYAQIPPTSANIAQQHQLGAAQSGTRAAQIKIWKRPLGSADALSDDVRLTQCLPTLGCIRAVFRWGVARCYVCGLPLEPVHPRCTVGSALTETRTSTHTCTHRRWCAYMHTHAPTRARARALTCTHTSARTRTHRVMLGSVQAVMNEMEAILS